MTQGEGAARGRNEHGWDAGPRAQGAGRREGAGRGCTSRLCFDRFDSISFCEGGFDSLFETVRVKPLAHLSVRAS